MVVILFFLSRNRNQDDGYLCTKAMTLVRETPLTTKQLWYWVVRTEQTRLHD
jgi:hypothetical protein